MTSTRILIGVQTPGEVGKICRRREQKRKFNQLWIKQHQKKLLNKRRDMNGGSQERKFYAISSVQLSHTRNHSIQYPISSILSIQYHSISIIVSRCKMLWNNDQFATPVQRCIAVLLYTGTIRVFFWPMDKFSQNYPLSTTMLVVIGFYTTKFTTL